MKAATCPGTSTTSRPATRPSRRLWAWMASWIWWSSKRAATCAKRPASSRSAQSSSWRRWLRQAVTLPRWKPACSWTAAFTPSATATASPASWQAASAQARSISAKPITWRPLPRITATTTSPNTALPTPPTSLAAARSNARRRSSTSTSWTKRTTATCAWLR